MSDETGQVVTIVILLAFAALMGYRIILKGDDL